jgi:hemolysin III
MNCITHGLGIILAIIGSILLSAEVQGKPSNYVNSCAIYSASLIVLFSCSTLYHSFFALTRVRFIFRVFDRCAIYLLIGGSYSPLLNIALQKHDYTKLLWFIWTYGCCGMVTEATLWNWKHKSKFSLAMYFGIAWSCIVCVPDLIESLPPQAMCLLAAGAVAYTSGVPFFVRNTNLDHSIWHVFVLAGATLHWLSVYLYVAKLPVS